MMDYQSSELRKISSQDVKEGDILVGHNLLATPAWLLDHKIPIDEVRFLDFCKLINAIALHNRIITLPAFIPQSLRTSKLYDYLTKNHVLFELNYSYDDLKNQEKEDARLLFGHPFSQDEAKYVSGQSVNNLPENEIEKDADEVKNYAKSIVYDEYITDSVGSAYNEYHIGEGGLEDQRQKFIENMIKTDKSNWNQTIYKSPLFDNGNLYLRFHRLRTAIYWIVAAKFSLAFLPDFMRIPMIDGYNIRLKKSLRMYIQDEIDKRANEQIVRADIAEVQSFPIPNVTLQFLENYSKSDKDLENTLNGLRKKFQEHNKAIVKWESIVHNPEASTKDVSKAMEQINNALESLENTDRIQASVSIGTAALSVLKMILGSSYGGTPLSIDDINSVGGGVKDGVSLIRKLYNRSRISYYYDGMKQASLVTNQNKLIDNAFGDSFTKMQSERFVKLSESANRIINAE
jgi:hypothetical protein